MPPLESLSLVIQRGQSHRCGQGCKCSPFSMCFSLILFGHVTAEVTGGLHTQGTALQELTLNRARVCEQKRWQSEHPRAFWVWG